LIDAFGGFVRVRNCVAVDVDFRAVLVGAWRLEATRGNLVHGAFMKRREMLRASVLGGAAAALTPALAAAQQSKTADAASEKSELTPAQRGVDASDELKVANWKPVFLDEHQNETLIILSDLIIPTTDTPGAKEALVNRYIDLVMAAETHENQKSFLGYLAYIVGESMR
jgi:hypothetical protein